jgi:hypothetical protein
MIKEFITYNGYMMYISEEDFLFYSGEKIYTYRPGISLNLYAVRIQKGKHIKIHQEIWKRMGRNVPKGYVIDHIDLIGLHNQRDNLRILTRAENCYHKSMMTTNTSGFRGISENKNCKYKIWQMDFGFDSKRVRSGHYTLEEAIEARLSAERKYLPYYLQREFYIERGIVI